MGWGEELVAPGLGAIADVERRFRGRRRSGDPDVGGLSWGFSCDIGGDTTFSGLLP